MSQHVNTQPNRTAKHVLDDTGAIATDHCVNDWYDTTTLASEHLEDAESLFFAIAKLLEVDDVIALTCRSHAKRLARLGSAKTLAAAEQFYDQTARLDDIVNAEGAAK